MTTPSAEPRGYAVFLGDQAPLDASPEDGGGSLQFVLPTADGVRLMNRDAALSTVSHPPNDDRRAPGLVQALRLRTRTAAAVMFDDPTAAALNNQPELVDAFATKVLAVPSSARWREAISTAVIGSSWCAGLLSTGHLPATALGALKAEARTLHRQLVPLWRRRTRHGRVLSLDADLGGLSLHDLVSAHTELLTHTNGGVFEDQRLNSVLRHLNPAEQQVVFAFAAEEGTT
ncbi:hypothetical protein H1V43_33685 [Streptomyces sp. PSKA54]|uniref:Uncharacterized protein n=1 Tax=Streptomyces himalayensis subsp. aureolus TaxID=2758039 RepID=A0A7W2HJJ6_9ACTN|nr:hypothetical protein [Streptomyces himalayensis]MBA4866191.1 hypothetical protein [Streptomyces himalayensis subsp. aureolus]